MIASASFDLCSYQRYSTWIWYWASIPARQQQEESQEAEDRRRDACIVSIHADAELRVVHRWIEGERSFECFLDALAVAGGGDALFPIDAVLRAHPVCGAEIEPGLGALRLGVGHTERIVDRALGGRHEGGIEGAITEIELDLPPQAERFEAPACDGRRRRARRRQDLVQGIEIGVEDEVVGVRDDRCGSDAWLGLLKRDGRSAKCECESQQQDDFLTSHC